MRVIRRNFDSAASRSSDGVPERPPIRRDLPVSGRQKPIQPRVERAVDPVQSGWDVLNDTYEQGKTRADGYYPRLEVSPEPIVVAFLEEAPFVAYKQHWVEWAKGRKSFVCLREDCPLCDPPSHIPDEARRQIARTTPKFMFNVVKLREVWEDAPLEVKVLECGSTVASQLAEYARQPRTSPISKPEVYWAVSRKKIQRGGRETYVWTISPVGEADLEKYYRVSPLTDEEREELASQLYTKDIVKVDPVSAIEELLNSLFRD